MPFDGSWRTIAGMPARPHPKKAALGRAVQPARELLAEGIMTVVVASAAHSLGDPSERQYHLQAAEQGIALALQSNANWLPAHFKRKRGGFQPKLPTQETLKQALSAFESPPTTGRPRKGSVTRSVALSALLRECGIAMSAEAVRQRLSASKALRALLAGLAEVHSSHLLRP